MKITYDSEVDAGYISFKSGPTQVTTARLSEDIAVVLGPNEEILGIEVLDASRHMGFAKTSPKVSLENLERD